MFSLNRNKFVMKINKIISSGSTFDESAYLYFLMLVLPLRDKPNVIHFIRFLQHFDKLKTILCENG